MQHYVIPHNGTWGVPTDEVFLPAVLKRARGFKTTHTGKHHMGMAKWSYTPTFRGYDSFVGYYGGECTYFGCFYDTTYDMHRDMLPECGPGCSEVAWDLDSTYSTYIFTDRAVEVIEETDAQADRLFLYVGEPCTSAREAAGGGRQGCCAQGRSSLPYPGVGHHNNRARCVFVNLPLPQRTRPCTRQTRCLNSMWTRTTQPSPTRSGAPLPAC